MAQEIESFFLKFKSLLSSGKNATLNMKSESGKVLVSLTAEVNTSEIFHLQRPARNGPARQRRRDRRAADREAAVKAAGAATEELSEEENMLTAIGADEASNVTNEPATTVAETVVKAGLNSNVISVEPEDAVSQKTHLLYVRK